MDKKSEIVKGVRLPYESLIQVLRFFVTSSYLGIQLYVRFQEIFRV